MPEQKVMIDIRNSQKPMGECVEPFENVLTEVLSKNRSSLLSIARKIAGSDDSEEILHDSIAKALKLQPTTEHNKLLWWLIRVITNGAHDVVKKRRSGFYGLQPNGETDHTGSDFRRADAEVIEKEHLARAVEAINELPPRQQTAFLMRESGNLSRKSIAEVTGRSPRQVRRDLERARAKLYEATAEGTGGPCEEFNDLVQAYATGILNVAERAKARVHLTYCGSCRSRLIEFKALKGRLSELIPPIPLVLSGKSSGLIRELFEDVYQRLMRPFYSITESANSSLGISGANAQAIVAATTALAVSLGAITIGIDSTVSSSASGDRSASTTLSDANSLHEMKSRPAEVSIRGLSDSSRPESKTIPSKGLKAKSNDNAGSNKQASSRDRYEQGQTARSSSRDQGASGSRMQFDTSRVKPVNEVEPGHEFKESQFTNKVEDPAVIPPIDQGDMNMPNGGQIDNGGNLDPGPGNVGPPGNGNVGRGNGNVGHGNLGR